MPTTAELVGALIKEMSPVLIEFYKVESNRKNIGKLETISKEYLTGASVVNMAEGLKVKVAQGCPACAAKIDQAHGHAPMAQPILRMQGHEEHDISHEPAEAELKEELRAPLVIPPGIVPPEEQVHHTTEEHLRYTDQQIVKQLVLLEEHFKSYQCGECIEKHLLGLEGYAEEGMGMNGPEPYTAVQRWARQALSRKDYPDLYREARDLRRQLQPHSHEVPPLTEEAVAAVKA